MSDYTTDQRVTLPVEKEVQRLKQVKQELVEALEEFIRNPAGDNTEENAIAILAKHKEQA